MYCTKVPEGRERIEIRKYSSAFLPSFISAEAQAGCRETRRFIVPGYIFSIRKEGNAVQVPENEWRIIETLSDPHPSVINEQDEIISGPLTGICDLIRKTEKNRVQIRASLLGEERTYWVRVRRTERPPENKTAGTAQRKEEAEMEHTQ